MRSTVGVTLTPITAPLHRVRMMSAGRLFRRPPSTRRLPPLAIGGASPGIEQLARVQSHTGPRSCTDTRAWVRSEDVQK